MFPWLAAILLGGGDGDTKGDQGGGSGRAREGGIGRRREMRESGGSEWGVRKGDQRWGDEELFSRSAAPEPQTETHLSVCKCPADVWTNTPPSPDAISCASTEQNAPLLWLVPGWHRIEGILAADDRDRQDYQRQRNEKGGLGRCNKPQDYLYLGL